MTQYSSKKLPLAGVDLDMDETKSQPDHASFIKNMTFNVNKNTSSPSGEGFNFGVLTPMEGNAIISNGLTFPVGTNICVGTYESKDTNELYVFVWNSNQQHFIYRIVGNGSAQMVYKSPCLNFQLDPKHYIGESKCVVKTVSYDDRTNDLDKKKKYLIFTDDFNDQRLISVEDSIATDSFNSTSYPYFARGNSHDCSPCYLINLHPIAPIRCVGVSQISRNEVEERNKQNLLNDKGWQFRIKFIDVFYRESEHGIISERVFTIVGGNCIKTNNGLPRCFKLNVDAGCPLVDKIEVEFRTCTGNSQNLATDGGWFKYATIEKYNNCDNQPWYNRAINNPWQAEKTRLETAGGLTSEEIEDKIKYLTKYNSSDNTFDIAFCADKECQPVPEKETTRTMNELPLRSGSVAALGDSIILSNNLRGFAPLDCKEIDKMKWTVVPPVGGECEDNNLRTITVYAKLVNLHHNKQVALFKKIGDPDPNKWTFFGYGNPLLNFKGESGFLGYLAGTKYHTRSEQVMRDWTTGAENPLHLEAPGPEQSVNYLALQKFTFKVPPGKYSFRIASHFAKAEDSDYQRTSTFVYGKCTGNSLGVSSYDKELIIDCCAGDVRLADDIILIGDPTSPEGAVVQEGMVIESQGDQNPISLAKITLISSAGNAQTKGVKYTDHNGYWWASAIVWGQVKVEFDDDCAGSEISKIFTLQGVPGFPMYHSPLNGLWYTATNFDPKGRRVITGKVELCDHPEVGLGGVLVVLKHGQWAYTDSQGKWKIITHGKYGDFAGQDDLLILSQQGGCQLTACDDPCVSCFTDITVAYKDCSATPNRNTETGAVQAAIRGSNKFGLESGGRYGYGITMYDWTGSRHSFVQASDKHYIDIPSLRETKIFDFPTVQFDISGMVFPSWVKYITFCITDNLNNDDSLMWIVDRVEFIDASGKPNTANPEKIRLHYASIAEYNEQNNFSTNTNWQFIIDKDDKTTTVKGDYVEFIKNGDNTWFDKNITALVMYDSNGRYFDIAFDGDLQGLKEGALIKLIRPKQCVNKYTYFELCPTIEINDLGLPLVTSGMINPFDSYFLARTIPIPVFGKDGDGKETKEVSVTNFTFFFEHNSPSDFWGDHCANLGRPNIKNPYERQKRYISEIAQSKALTHNGSYNGLGYFEAEDATQFDEQEWGAIVAVLVEITNLLVITEVDNFVAGFNDTNVRVNDLNVVAGSAPGQFGRPFRKIGGNFGCQAADQNTIRKHNGMVVWLDRAKSSLVFHNYSDALDASRKGYKSYLTKKISYVNTNVELPFRYYFHAGIDPKTNEYYLSCFARPVLMADIRDTTYINDAPEPTINQKETIVIDLYTGALKGWAAFVPEYFGSLEGHFDNKVLFAFKTGHAYKHRTAGSVPFANFFGTQCKQTFELVFNDQPEKVKKWLSNEVYCKDHKFEATRVVTESGQESRIKTSWWESKDKFNCAPFLCDLNTYNDPQLPILATARLLEGDGLSGRWIKVRYQSQDVDDAKYCEISAVIVRFALGEKSDTQ